MANQLNTPSRTSRFIGRVWLVLIFLPAACALLVFPLMPDYFERMSIKASSVLDMIEMGRSRPWVMFTGMPYPAALRMFGNISALDAVLAFLVFLYFPLSTAVKGLDKNRLSVFTRKLENKSKRNKALALFLLGLCAQIFIIIESFITKTPVKIYLYTTLALHVLLACFSLSGIVFMAFLIGMMIYVSFIIQG